MSLFRSLISMLPSHAKVLSISSVASFHTATPHYAARKGTRARKEGKKVKVEIKKVAWTPDSKKKKEIHVSRKVDESNLQYPEDDIYIQKDYKQRTFNFCEAMECIRETHHPTMYNLPNAFVGATVEISTTTHNKKVKYVDHWTHLVNVDHTYEHGDDRSILAFCKEPELQAQLEEMGVALVGGVDTIKGIERGLITLPTFQFVVCNPKILPELMTIRGLLKRKIPSAKAETLGMDLVNIVRRLQTGVKYSMKKDPVDQEFGYSDLTLGKLNMTNEQLLDNFKKVLNDVNLMKPASKPRDEDFITRVLLWSNPSPERFKLDLNELLEKPKAVDAGEESDDEELVAAKA